MQFKHKSVNIIQQIGTVAIWLLFTDNLKVSFFFLPQSTLKVITLKQIWCLNPAALTRLIVNLSPDQLLHPECVSPESAESIPPQRLHGSRAMQSEPVCVSWPLSAQKSRQ